MPTVRKISSVWVTNKTDSNLAADMKQLNERRLVDKLGKTENFLYATYVRITEQVGCFSVTKSSEESRDFFGDTLLIWAAKTNNYAYLVKLIYDGIELNECNNLNLTALQSAVKAENIKVVKKLLASGADLDMPHSKVKREAKTRDKFKMTALMHAIKSMNQGIISLLLKYEQNINLQDSSGMTALMYAVKYGDRQLVGALIEKGADASVLDRHGMSALNYSISNEQQDIRDYLVNNNGLISASNNINISLLIDAVEASDEKRILFCLRYGVDVNAVGNTGKSALEISAIDLLDTRVTALLMFKGAGFYTHALQRAGDESMILAVAQKNTLKRLIPELQVKIEGFLSAVVNSYANNIKAYMPSDKGFMWGGEIEIAVLKHFFDLNITLQGESGSGGYEYSYFNVEETSRLSQPEIKLYYNGIHYQYVCPDDGAVVDVPGDGNCLFHALALGLNKLIEQNKVTMARFDARELEAGFLSNITHKKLREIVSWQLLSENDTEHKNSILRIFEAIFNSESTLLLKDIYATIGECELTKKACYLRGELYFLTDLERKLDRIDYH